VFAACSIMPAGSIAGALYCKLQTQSSAPEDGRNYRPKHVELIVIINKMCYCCIYLAVYITVSVMHGHTDIKIQSLCLSRPNCIALLHQIFVICAVYECYSLLGRIAVQTVERRQGFET